MAPLASQIMSTFKNLENLDTQSKFWDVVADDVDWEIPGHSPMSRKYNSKQDFLSATIDILGNKVLKEKLRIKPFNVIGGGECDWATVEMHAVENTCRNGLPYDMRYCWCVRYEGERIVQVRAYIDTELLTRAVEQNA